MWKGPSRTNQNYQIKYVVSDGWGDPIQINRRPTSKMSFSNYEKEQLKESIGILTISRKLYFGSLGIIELYASAVDI